MRRVVAGIFAHVDAGKTTLSEGLLYASGATGRLGRVDRRDAHLDTFALERERGITIFSHQVRFTRRDTEVVLIDTPGHIDFFLEAERAADVLDYAVLLISAPQGIESHTRTLWNMLRNKGVPTFIFVNKIDICERSNDEIMQELRQSLGSGCVAFLDAAMHENVAACDEELMAEFFDTGALTRESVCRAVSECKVFPTYFGSALKMRGVEELLDGFVSFVEEKSYHKTLFGARVYKIASDDNGARLTYLKITGGSLMLKDTLVYTDTGGKRYEQKVEQIREYSADKYTSKKSASAGGVYAVLGLDGTYAGQGLGVEEDMPRLYSAVLDYRLILPEGINPYEAYLKIAELGEMEPGLRLNYDERRREIRLSLMGPIQTEVISRIILDRYGYEVSFDEGSILYKETLSEGERIVCAAHFEPLRHYAEVHLAIEPASRGAGIVVASECHTDTLSLNWQRLILTHIEEKIHRGTLTGSPLTDVKITLLAGKAHLKHTEGGDFRQATYRAIRQGLMKARQMGRMLLLEPTFEFRASLPLNCLGRFLNDLSAMGGEVLEQTVEGEMTFIFGTAPVSKMRSYALKIRAYTAARGKIDLVPGAYAPAADADEVISSLGYEPELDERNSASSVFMKQGAGYSVLWSEADALMHIRLSSDGEPQTDEAEPFVPRVQRYSSSAEEDKELMRIFERTYGKIKPRTVPTQRENAAQQQVKRTYKRPTLLGEGFIVIDGYNYIFASKRLSPVAEKDIGAARDELVRLMCSYAAFYRCRAFVVFDAYNRQGEAGVKLECGRTQVIYTKQMETADSYIERFTYENADKHSIRVVTNDREEQYVVLGNGALRVSAKEFDSELLTFEKQLAESLSQRG